MIPQASTHLAQLGVFQRLDFILCGGADRTPLAGSGMDTGHDAWAPVQPVPADTGASVDARQLELFT